MSDKFIWLRAFATVNLLYYGTIMTAEKGIKKDTKSIKLNQNSTDALKIQNPCHRKIYVPMLSDNEIKVGMKEILQHPTKNADGTIKDNPPIPVYDTSGPYSDDNYKIDLNNGIEKLRQKWILERSKNIKITVLKCI